LKERGKDTKPWGDLWYRPKSVIPTDGGETKGRAL
jgi:hypothetical protein